MTALAPSVPRHDDPLHDPDARTVADVAATEGLLRCWVRENDLARPDSGTLRLSLPATGARLDAEVRYWSATGWHRFGQVRLAGGVPASAVLVASLLATEAATRRAPGAPICAAAVTDLTGRVADSVTRVAGYVAARRDAAENPPGTPAFLAAEQALLLGHPLHPAPKSREGLSPAQAWTYSPELRGAFPLHWFAADPSVVRSGSATSTSAMEIAAGLASDGLPEPPPGTIMIPAHPWQAREVLVRPGTRALIDAALLHDLGPGGPDWYPTLSVRTVYRPDAAHMLKLSLGLRITNSKRENLVKELRRGEEAHRLLDAGLGASLATVHPYFDVVRDPAWLAVEAPGGERTGLEAVLRDNPFAHDDRVACVAGLVAERPDGGRSALAVTVEDLATRAGRTVPDVAEEWFARYLAVVVTPVLWLYATHGIGLEAHQQNTLVVLDEHGWPAGGRYRDNQGYYISASRAGELERFLPGVGEASDSRCADAVIDERIGYYLGINNVLGLVGAFGSQGLAGEHRLLARFRALLRGMWREHGKSLRLAGVLAEASTLRCKANLLTRVDGLDELVGPLESQSVYCDIANPLLEAGS